MRCSRHNKENLLGSPFEFPEAQMQQASAAPDNAAEMRFSDDGQDGSLNA
jgi:hypothetical protein